MKSLNNIGNWSAIVKTDGKAPEIIVTGTFPTNGEKPIFELVKNISQGINPRILLLTILNGHVIDINGKEISSISKPFQETLNMVDQYDRVSIMIINAEETEVYIDTVLVTDMEQQESFNFKPYLETLKGIEIIGKKIIIRVPSGGLTSSESFQIDINEGITQQPPFLLSIKRIKPDFGKAFLPNGVTLEYILADYTSNTSASFKLENLISI